MTMPSSTAIPGTCNLCHTTVPGNRIRQHLLRCIEARTGLSASRAPRSKDRRRNALKTAYISIRSREQPHWLELGVRCDAQLHELDRFLRALWLECCGHMSHFMIGGVAYSAVVPKPGDNWRFEPMYDGEEKWRHMGKSVNAAIPLRAKFEHEFDYGSPTELVLEHVAVFGELVQWLALSQPWHGGKIVVLARNNSLRPCLRCRRPAQWKAVPECEEDEEYYYEYDEELYGGRCDVGLRPGPGYILRGVRSGGRGLPAAAQLAPGGNGLLRQRALMAELAPAGGRRVVAGQSGLSGSSESWR